MNHPGFPANNKGRRRSNSFAISPHLGGSSSWLEGHLRKGVLTSGEGTWRDGAGGGEAYTRFNQQGLLSGWICELFRLATLGVPARMPVPWSIDGGVVGGRRISQRGAFPRARAAAMRARALLTALTAIALAAIGNAEKSKFYYMDSLCKDHFLQRQYRKLDGGVLWSRNERNLDCTVTFQTHSILQRFMLHFDLLQLDCNDHLYVYDGAHATAPPKADLSCRNTKQQVGALFTRSNFVTLKYVTDNWGTEANGFKLVITAVKDPKHGCKEFRCKQREFCVSADLTCDGVDHCADGSDEDTAALCPESGGGAGGGPWVVAGAGGAVLATISVAAAVCCYCRRRAPARRTHLHLQQMASSNGSGGGGKGAASPATRLPGNWAHPAGPRGYRAARPGRLRARAQR